MPHVTIRHPLAFNPKTDIEFRVKPISWCADSLERIRAFPEMARRKTGQQLNRLQHGFEPHDWKPMSEIGPGVGEIRIHELGEYRVFFVARFEEAIYVLHAFNKKSQRTPQRVLALAAARYSAVVAIRRRAQR